MLFPTWLRAACPNFVTGLITTLLSALFLTSSLSAPANSNKGDEERKRDDAPIETHIKTFFNPFTNDMRIGSPEKVGVGKVWPVVRSGEIVGYVFNTLDFSPLPGYSGRPIEALVAIDPQGKYIGARILFHEEPIFFGDHSVVQPDRVANQYAGLKVQDTIRVRGAYEDVRDKEGYSYVDGISRATISIEVLNQSIIDSAIAVATEKIEGFTLSRVAIVNLYVSEQTTWDNLIKSDWLAKNSFTYGQVYKAFDGTSKEFSERERTANENEKFSDIYVAQVNVPTIGKYFLGEAGFKRLVENELTHGENAFILLSNGPYSFLEEDFVPGSVASRVSIEQGDRIFEVQDVYFFNYLSPEWPKDMPPFKQARLFKTSAYDAFDPSLPWKLNLNVVRGTHRFSSSVIKALPTYYELPERFFIKQDLDANSRPLWVDLWTNRWMEIVLLLVGLGVLTAISVRPSLIVKNAKQFKVFRWAYLLYTVGFIGYYTQAQLSVTHVLTLIRTFFDSAAASGLLLDPIICILGVYVLFTLIIWGRGFFCGWLCPFGVLQEFMAWLGEKLRLPQPKFAWATHSFGNKIKYLIFAGLVAVSLFSVGTAEVMAEVEPFKTAITLNFVRSWPFVVYAVALLLASMFVHKFFCRYLCPLGAGLAILGKLRIIDSIKRRDECGTPCQLCSVKCGIKAIKPTGEIDYDECIQCYDCIVIHDDKTQCVPLVLAEKKKTKQHISGQPAVIRPSPIKPIPIEALQKSQGRHAHGFNAGRMAASLILLSTASVWFYSSHAQVIPLTVSLGTEVSPEVVAAADLSITPDGGNLPIGSGTHAQGKVIFDIKCVSCHGVDGAGGEGLVEPLVGGMGTLDSDAPVKTVGSFWPFATTLFDYVRRSMPLDAPLSLSDDEVYALCAYLLAENGVIEKTAVMNAETLPKVQMPNRFGFVSKWPGYDHE